MNLADNKSLGIDMDPASYLGDRRSRMSMRRCLSLMALLTWGAMCSVSSAQMPVAAVWDNDYGQVNHYNAANMSFQKSNVTARVVFLGDSITEYWGVKAGTWFSDAGWLNRGIGGQTTSQELLRERTDVIALRPQAVVLEGGSNDMRLGSPSSVILNNIASMGELAEAHHIRVFVSAMAPVCDCFTKLSGLRTVERIQQLNADLRRLCSDHHWQFLDTNSPLADAKGLIRREYTLDGVHPNAEGYAVLSPVFLEALKSFR